jgi:hypothetical protein
MIRLRQLKKWDAVYWACPPDLAALTMPQKMAAKADGYEAGVFDLTIIGARKHLTKVWLIEFKYGKNTYTKEGKETSREILDVTYALPFLERRLAKHACDTEYSACSVDKAFYILNKYINEQESK